ncbi:MAG: methyltransferase domain-containing protein [Solirubrobacterales bacterium]|nr:methyltransferase domain-containing protein [Solirubrobacterales bacterium]MBV9473943.1 methyltransferase domain-containing protein [Solirubrobacterales bacterium]
MELRERISEIEWYHTLELAPGVVTKGLFDLRPWVHRYGLPERLDGMRVLDVGSFDGFWAFELERRGAAEVVALDLDDEAHLDWPPRRRPARFRGLLRGEGFRLASEALGSRARRVICNIYEADPAELGTFDLVICGMVLIHLRDQLLALERIARLCRGIFISAEEFDPATGLLPFPAARYRADRDASVVFWQPSARTWRRMIWSAGFNNVRRHRSFKMPSSEGYSIRHLVHHAAASVLAGQSSRRSSTGSAGELGPEPRHDLGH